MAIVHQIPYKYDMNKYHEFRSNSPVKTAFQIGNNSEMRVVTVHENGLLAFTDDRKRELWCSKPLTDNGDNTLSFNG